MRADLGKDERKSVAASKQSEGGPGSDWPSVSRIWNLIHLQDFEIEVAGEYAGQGGDITTAEIGVIQLQSSSLVEA